MDIMHSLGLPAEPPPAQKKAPDRHFHWFPYLHQDVRLLIWEAAMRPQPSKNYNATHRFRVHTWEGDNPSLLETSDVGYKSPPLYGSRVTRGLDDHKMREPMSLCPEVLKSVVHWDYGLWKACIESRWVISRRFRWKYWEEMKKSVLKDLQTVPKEIREPFTMEAAWQNEDLLMQNGYPERHSKWYKDFASVVSIDGMYNNIVAIHPARDLFIMEDERWMHELARQLTDTEQEDKAVQLFRENAISPTSDGSPILGNIGFVFDISWSNGITRLDNPPMRLTEAKTKNNPRGLFLLLLHLTVVRIIGGVRLWLIDETFDPCRTCKTEKDAEKEVEEEKRDRKVFYRYGKEDLVEVDVKPNVMRVLIDNASCILATSCGFLEYLSRDPIAGNSAFNPDPRAKPLNIWSCVGVLVPRSRTLME
ncbi:uncharacterized protein LW94_1576 [Fusarium fujikuroi]|uniref:Uncharacterized protein n=1 Tax=Fusarium fujikuroi TaxID=5127 RepID=A0A0I9YZM2_FUSFU|nr:uncharacterized protein LW93_14426 [Fusarium fujikuroi]KLP01107.1 uncharacterized protein Y057_1327 [Fusarium fujikuroi]KLP21260.1 uncharacterized protein LW94_1576 [Fusarium fujikuroi]QGI61076.1 hypothetical protein CEK27_005047 [Fusarium fujikuroi]QGI78254.1 hypothetical protein CEK25_004983 [Fusarium fujikuroi]